MIELREVTKTFTEEKAVDQLALTVKKGSIFGLLGSNGAGKTTLLKIIAGIYRPDAGKVLIGGQSVYEQPEVKQHILFMPDTPIFSASDNSSDGPVLPLHLSELERGTLHTAYGDF